MLRRIVTALALAALLAPVARANDWEEDYTNDGWRDESPPPDDYPVAADVDAPPVTIDAFQSSLAPYGDWVVVGSYGRVWRPHVAAGWRPYYYGRWEWTSEGWLWVSDEPFGWAAYHYGRWALDPTFGWVWVPGYEWAPAWVSWRYSGEVVGWAPLGPGVSVYVSSTPYVAAWWTFVPCDRFVAEPVYRIAYEPARTRRFFFDSAPAPARPGYRPGPGRPLPAPAWGGPPPRAIEQRIGRPITPVRVVAAPSPGPGRTAPGEVSIFRPGVRAGGPVARPSPSAVPPRQQGFSARGGGVRGDDLRPRTGVPARTERPQDQGRGWAGDGRGGAGPVAPPAPGPRQEHDRSFAPRGWTGPSTAPQGERRMAPQVGQSGRPQARIAPQVAVPREGGRPAFSPRAEAPRVERGPQARSQGGDGERHR